MHPKAQISILRPQGPCIITSGGLYNSVVKKSAVIDCKYWAIKILTRSPSSQLVSSLTMTEVA
jgi:hypothetical protein